MVKSTRLVDLRDGVYRGLWYEYVLLIPFHDGEKEIPVSRGTPVQRWKEVTVKNQVLFFEGD